MKLLTSTFTLAISLFSAQGTAEGLGSYTDLIKNILLAEWCEKNHYNTLAQVAGHEAPALSLLNALSPLAGPQPESYANPTCRKKLAEWMKRHWIATKTIERTSLLRALGPFKLSESASQNILSALSESSVAQDDAKGKGLVQIVSHISQRNYAFALQELFPLTNNSLAYRFAYDRLQRAYSFAERGSGGVALRSP